LKTDLECIPCIIKQVLNTLDTSGAGEEKRQEVLRKVLQDLNDIDYNQNPAFNSTPAYHIFSRVTSIEDPYCDLKIDYNQAVMELYPSIEKMVLESADSLKTAARAAVAGNVIDFGVHLGGKNSFDLEQAIKDISDIPLSIDHFPVFVRDLERSEKILYISDNAGEIVFDRLFISRILAEGKEVVLTVKSGPIINDATVDDAREAGLDRMSRIVETGNNCIGIDLKKSSTGFLKEFKDADIIISKGQGNFESLDEIKGKKIFFLLKAKCEKIARELGVNYLDVVFMKSRYYQ
jgi:damage-control phosphatase, subfamily I